MNLFPFVFFVFATIVYCENAPRLVGGRYAEPGEFPHQVSIQQRFLHYFWLHRSSANIISENILVTSAHPIITIRNQLDAYRIVAGAVDLRQLDDENVQIGEILDIIVHPDYNIDSGTLKNDIAVIFLSHPLVFNVFVKQIAMSPIIGSSKVTAAGWGSTFPLGFTSNRLKIDQYQIISNDECAESFNVQEDQMCVIWGGGEEGVIEDKPDVPEMRKGLCSGDSGGALVQDDKLIAIASYGDVTCGLIFSTPSVFVRIAQHIDFIKNAQITFKSTY